MRLTVLGKSPSWQDAGGACSGYLLEEHGTAVLLDCGNGVFGKLRQRIDYVDVDAVVISHLHADHFLDLVPYSYALTYAPRQQPVPVDRWPGTDNPARPELHGPPGARETFRRVVGAWGNDDLIENAFDLTEFDRVERAVDRARPVDVPGGAPLHRDVRDATQLGQRVGRDRLRGPTRVPPRQLTKFAAGADLLLVEATLPRPERTGMRGHLTPAEAGEHARAAGAKRLVLVHISDELDAEWARKEAKEAFGGPVEVASEGATFRGMSAPALSAKARTALGAICDTFVPGGDGLPSATEQGVPEALLGLVARNPRAAERKQVSQLLGLWDTRLLSAIAGGGAHRFSSLSQERRERVLLSWADSRVVQPRAASRLCARAPCSPITGQAATAPATLPG